jgi:hypothetical protein
MRVALLVAVLAAVVAAWIALVPSQQQPCDGLDFFDHKDFLAITCNLKRNVK